MTQDEIIEMAIEAEFVSHGKPSDEESELFVCVDKDIYKFAKLVAAKEREACANLCWKNEDDNAFVNQGGKRLDLLCAELIRARGEA
jgi:hypothetical protein